MENNIFNPLDQIIFLFNYYLNKVLFFNLKDLFICFIMVFKLYYQFIYFLTFIVY